MKDEHSRMLGSQCEDPTLVSSTFQVTVFGKRMDSSSKRHLRESSNSIPSSMTDARFVQSLLLATPLYFYYQHLTPPGYFSSLLKGLVHMRNVTEEPSVVLECGINLTRNSTIKPNTTKRKIVCDGTDRKTKRSKDRTDSSPRVSNSPEQPLAASPTLR